MNVNVDLDIDDILWNLSKYEKKELLSELISEMDIEDVIKIIKSTNLTPELATISLVSDEEFNQKIIGLLNNRHKLTNEDEKFLYTIAERVNP